MTTALVCWLAVILDHWLGEPGRWHPLVGFGRLTAWVESRFYGPANLSPGQRRLRGVGGVLLLVLPFVLLAKLPAALPLGWVLEVILLYITLGARSLGDHARPVAAALAEGDLPEARRRVSWMVSRDSVGMDQTQISRAGVESVLENGNDAIFATLFWFLLAGTGGAVVHRLVNTLDASWGYRTQRLEHFGWFAARTDDLLNWPPARLTALSYALLGKTRRALDCWRRQAPAWDSPNAGPVMAAGAGALELELGGGAWYHGRWQHRPPLGAGRPPVAADISRALALVQRSLLLWLLVITLGDWALA
ncbi:MAG: adenosylcobinamide-phosphate synthase CbiB [Candidatus Competibacteraceae bacterium]|nr:adenosylcobinamide-phosphate synthase CbiB [Candidatus Competibacteraceae bacterium]